MTQEFDLITQLIERQLVKAIAETDAEIAKFIKSTEVHYDT